MPEHRRRARVLLAGLSLLVLAFGLCAFDARARRPADHATRTALVRAIGHADLALSSSTRWIRHPSHAEPMAALQDGPGLLDTDSGGAWVGPPVEKAP